MDNNSTSITESIFKFIRQKSPHLLTTIAGAILGYYGNGYINPSYNGNVNGVNNPSPIVQVTSNASFTRAEYMRLNIGMELVEVEAILGAGIETSSSTDTATYIWKNANESYIEVTFKDGKLESKKQHNLL